MRRGIIVVLLTPRLMLREDEMDDLFLCWRLHRIHQYGHEDHEGQE